MEWFHNLVLDSTFNAMGTAITPYQDGVHTLWLKEWVKRGTFCINFESSGKIMGAFSVIEVAYDALMPFSNGYVLVFSHDGKAVVSGRSYEHRELWSHQIDRADPSSWRLAESKDGSLHILYGYVNPHDAHREARLMVIDSADPRNIPRKHTFADIDFQRCQVVATMPDRIGVCLRNNGAHVVSYILNAEDGELQSSASFRAHPHSKWSVPLCLLPVLNGEFLLAGYQEEEPGVRRPWLCRFDADFTALVGIPVPAPHAEQAITALQAVPNGPVLALCPPWTIYRLSNKGFITHSWTVPENTRDNVVSAVLPSKDGGCFITGRSYTKDKSQAAWLAKLADSDFAEV